MAISLAVMACRISRLNRLRLHRKMASNAIALYLHGNVSGPIRNTTLWREHLFTLVEIVPPETSPGGAKKASGAHAAVLRLEHDARHVRRRVLQLEDGREFLIDLPEPTVLQHGDTLVLDDGTRVLVQAAVEDLYDIRAASPVHLLELAWHIGNRHLTAEIREDRILILRDHVIKAMLEKLGATVSDTRAPFVPVRGAYAGSGQHHHHHHHAHDHGQGHAHSVHEA